MLAHVGRKTQGCRELPVSSTVPRPRVEKHLKTLWLLGLALGEEAHVLPQVANMCGKLATWFNEFKVDVKGWS